MPRDSIDSSRLLAADAFAVSTVGLRTRKLRAALSALGVTIGIASVVAVLGLSASSKAGLLQELDKLGTNLLTLQPGQDVMGEDAKLPAEAGARLSLLPGVQQAASVTDVSGTVRRSRFIPAEETNGITLKAATTNLLAAVGGSVAHGRWLNAANARYPVTVLGATAARRMGIHSVGNQVYVDGHMLTVVGILDPLPLAPELEAAAFVGAPLAQSMFGAGEDASEVYLAADPDRVIDVRKLLASTANPENPEEVQVGRPSDALAAKAAATGTLTGLFLGLGAVALLVGAIGIANTMIISVLERRVEIGLRRALGATRRHIRLQFFGEALLLALFGGAAGVLLGAIVTAGYSAARAWPVTLPPAAAAAALVAALSIGAVAGLYPAARAARMAPTEALRG